VKKYRSPIWVGYPIGHGPRIGLGLGFNVILGPGLGLRLGFNVILRLGLGFNVIRTGTRLRLRAFPIPALPVPLFLLPTFLFPSFLLGLAFALVKDLFHPAIG
jgi:hypothetical protein